MKKSKGHITEFTLRQTDGDIPVITPPIDVSVHIIELLRYATQIMIENDADSMSVSTNYGDLVFTINVSVSQNEAI